MTAGGQYPGESIHANKGLNGWTFVEEKGELRSLKSIMKSTPTNIYSKIKTGISIAWDNRAVNGSRLISLSIDESRIALCELDGAISLLKLPNLEPITDACWPLRLAISAEDHQYLLHEMELEPEVRQSHQLGQLVINRNCQNI